MGRRTAVAIVVAVIGLALVVLEAVQSLRGDVLGTTAAIMLWGGLGLFVIASVVMITEASGE